MCAGMIQKQVPLIQLTWLNTQDVKSFATCEHSREESIFTLLSPPDVGYYKLEIYAARLKGYSQRIRLIR